MEIDYKKLNDGLAELTGYDYAACEKQARAMGDSSADVNFSKIFHATLAAKILGVPFDEIQALKIGEYVKVTGTVSNFLLAGLAEMVQERPIGK